LDEPAALVENVDHAIPLRSDAAVRLHDEEQFVDGVVDDRLSRIELIAVCAGQPDREAAAVRELVELDHGVELRGCARDAGRRVDAETIDVTRKERRYADAVELRDVAGREIDDRNERHLTADSTAVGRRGD